MMRRAFSSALFLLLCTACGGDVIYDKQIAGPYRLLAVDILEGAHVCLRTEDAFCVGDELPDPAVFAAGGDHRYIVFARHPHSFEQNGPIDKSVTEYFYIIRQADERFHGKLVGPLSAAAFEREKRRLALPRLSIRINA